MNTEKWQSWLQGWLKSHPVKELPAAMESTYTSEVMARVRGAQAPASSRARWAPVYRVNWSLAAAAAACIAAVVIWAPWPVGNGGLHGAEKDETMLAEVGNTIEHQGATLDEQIQIDDQMILEGNFPQENIEESHLLGPVCVLG